MQVGAGEARIVVDPVGRALRAVGQDPRQIEAEAVDAVGLMPQGERVAHEPLGVAVVVTGKVQVVAGAGGVGKESGRPASGDRPR